jgi:hypothetical protein
VHQFFQRLTGSKPGSEPPPIRSSPQIGGLRPVMEDAPTAVSPRGSEPCNEMRGLLEACGTLCPIWSQVVTLGIGTPKGGC